MKYSPLIWAAVWRRPIRVCLTFFSIVAAFLLFGLLHGISAGFDVAIEKLDVNRLRVNSADGFHALPIGYVSRIAELPNIHNTMLVTAVSGYFRDKTNWLAINAIGGDYDFNVFGDLRIPRDQERAFRTTRTAILVGRTLATRFGWKIGDKIPLGGFKLNREGDTTWYFDIVGIYNVPGSPSSENLLIFRFDYLDEERAENRGTSNLIYVDTSESRYNETTAEAIDALFANSARPTDTQTEREFQRAVLNQAIDIRLLVAVIVGTSLFALLFLTANTMMQSVRQRIPEMAVLKTIGFSDGKIVALVFTEAVLLCLSAAVLGLVIAKYLFPTFAGMLQMPYIAMPMRVFVLGVMIALGTAFVSSVVPAWRVTRLSIVDALADR